MKLEIRPILSCTSTEYTTEIEPIIKELDKIIVCPNRKMLDTTWNCALIEDCDLCPFGQAGNKIKEAVTILKSMEVK